MKKYACTLLMTTVLNGCNPKVSELTDELDYCLVSDVTIAWNDVFNQFEADYLVYFYSEICGHCREIKNEIIAFYQSRCWAMYFVCTDEYAVFGPRSDLKGIDNINDFYIFGTPFLCEIKNYVVGDYYVGVNSIREFINNEQK